MTIFGIEVEELSRQEILEKIKKYIFANSQFTHIVSLNPENIVIAEDNPLFKRVLATAQIKIIDGVGVALAGRLFGVPVGGRISGVDLMGELLGLADERRLRVALIGGGPKIAERVVDCQKRLYPRVNFLAKQGISDIQNPKTDEEQKLLTIVADFKPHLVFAAFGSPWQELWLDCHKDHFAQSVCMGVGGAFDYLSDRVGRAPVWFRQWGLEWLFRLFVQPWRAKRQLRLIRFAYLVLKELVKRDSR